MDAVGHNYNFSLQTFGGVDCRDFNLIKIIIIGVDFDF
jgi:hypothetical protein